MADERDGLSGPVPNRATPRLTALGVVRPLAAIGVAAFVFGRAVGPSALGIDVGMEPLISALDLTGGVLSQIFAVAVSVAALALVLWRWQANGNVFLRLSGLLLGGPVVMLALRAPAARVSETTALVIAGCAVALALVSGATALGARTVRPVALALLVQAAGGLAHLVALALQAWSTAEVGPPSPLVRGLATAAFCADVGALGIAVAWLSSRGRSFGNPLPFVALGVALLATHLVLGAADPDAGWVSVLLERSAERLVSNPDTYVGDGLRIFMAAAGPLLAIAALFTAREAPALTGSLALMLLVQSSADVPALALALVVAALAVGIAASEERARAATPAPEAPRAEPAGSAAEPAGEEAASRVSANSLATGASVYYRPADRAAQACAAL